MQGLRPSPSQEEDGIYHIASNSILKRLIVFIGKGNSYITTNFYFRQLSCSARNFSTSRAALQPLPAATMAWR